MATDSDIFNAICPNCSKNGTGEKYKINFAKRTPAQLEYCAEYILSHILPIAAKHNGKVFGGFVRDILVPRLVFQNPLKECDNFKDVDLWFISAEDARSFGKEIGLYCPDSIGEPHASAKNVSDPTLYEFNVYHNFISKAEQPVSFVDIIIAPELPVNDFNVNRLVAQVFDKEGKYELTSHDKPKSDLLNCISSKTVYMCPEYFDKIEKRDGHSLKIINRIKTRYIDRGWRVYIQNKSLDNSHFLILREAEKSEYLDVWDKFLY